MCVCFRVSNVHLGLDYALIPHRHGVCGRCGSVRHGVRPEKARAADWAASARPAANSFAFPACFLQMSYLRTHFPEGSAFLMGPMTGDHWFVFVADYVDRPTTECVDRTLDMMMFGIDEDVAKLFWKDDARFPKHSDVTKASGIDTLLPGSSIQEFCFDPCGYSMNGLLYDSYWTIHITPESHCSYASFETNIRMANYDSLIKAVLAIFRPQKFTTTLFADEHGLRQMKSMPFPQLLPVPLVDSQHRAIMGPCVLLADGNVETMVVAAAAAATAAVETEEKKAAETRAGERASTGGSAGELAADATSTPGTPVTPVATATTGGAGGAGSGSKSRVPRRGAANYVCAHKSMSEFMGYSCFMGNYQLVHAAQSSSSRNSLEAVPQAAKEKLSMPRAKYIVAQEAENMRNRLRTESM